MSKKALPKRTRVNIRIQTDLLKWAKDYAVKKNTTLTQMVIDFLTRERLNEDFYEHS